MARRGWRDRRSARTRDRATRARTARIRACARCRAMPVGVDGALEVVAQLLQDGSHQRGEGPFRKVARWRELVALMRRQALRTRASAPDRSWDRLERALAFAPEEPVLIVELIELAAELGKDDAVRQLLDVWGRIDDDAARIAMLSGWCAEAHDSAELRGRRRPLLMSLEA